MRTTGDLRIAVCCAVCLCLMLCASITTTAMPADARIVDLGAAGTAYQNLTPGIQGGTLCVVAPGEPRGWNPHASGLDPNSQWFTNLMFGGLVEPDPASGDLIPWLAKSWEVSAGAERITFHLRQDIQWSDGYPITAQDVAFTYNEIVLNTDAGVVLELPNGTYPMCSVVDDYTVSFEVTGLMRPLLSCLGFDILPKHILEPLLAHSAPEDIWAINTDPTTIVASGPWLVAEYMPGDYVEFSRNPNYWTYDSAGTQLPFTDSVVAMIIDQSAIRLLKFRNGEIDLYQPQPADIPVLLGSGSSSFTVLTTSDPTYGVSCLMLNQDIGLSAGTDVEKRSLYRTRYFREAIAELVDEATMIANVYNALALDLWSPVSIPSAFFAERSFFAGPYVGANRVTYGYAPTSAMAKLNSLGVVDMDGDGWRELPNGDPLEIEIQVDDGSEREACALIIQDAMHTAGLNATVLPIPPDLLLYHLETGRGDALVFELPGLDETHFDVNRYTSCGPLRVHRPSACSSPTFVDQTVDAIFDSAADTLNTNASFQDFVTYQQTVAYELELIFLVQPTFQFAHWNHVGNAQIGSPLSLRYDLAGRLMELLYIQ